MAKPIWHARSSARKWGGTEEDYLPIHQLMDSSKSVWGDNRHRALTHNTWFIGPCGPLETIFGVTLTNSQGKLVPVRDVGEQHCAEDFGGYIPTVEDYFLSFNRTKHEELPAVPPIRHQSLQELCKKSARTFGGHPYEYKRVHEVMNSSGLQTTNHYGLFLTHNSWFTAENGILSLMFPSGVMNSAGDTVPAHVVAGKQVLSVMGCIPTPQEILSNMIMELWMANQQGQRSPSYHSIALNNQQDKATIYPPTSGHNSEKLTRPGTVYYDR